MIDLDKIKNKVEEFNPVAVARNKSLKNRLNNRDFSILAPNCMGGIIYHQLALEFRSPTVNLMMLQTDFAKFVLNMDAYLALPLEFFEHSEYTFPCAHLGDITLHFTHFASKEEAELKWKERAERINRDNIFIIIEDRDGITKEELQSLAQLKVRGIVAFVAHDYSDIPYAVYMPKYANDGEVGNILKRNHLTNEREYEKYFDFVEWFNNARGGDYDVKQYIKR